MVSIIIYDPGDNDIYLLDPNTIDLFNLTNSDVDDYFPVWQP